MTTQEKHLVSHLVLELQGTYSEFRRQLSNNCPKLTEYDLRLCVLLKASLSTKEIATLLNITPDSVKKAKHRLRKKLSIDPNTIWSQVFKDR